ncbi:DUF4153 domain-containing protein [Hyunsoonleella ulvae]|uniref:DUF4153 domain-containing protein n=1 Tax=Hyunsoonleella ulvae TaxID=2799948 RepID=UPI001939A32D|nr:DUF4173 domain-containing protein [Hyunsoonleella ulvae]
MKQIPLIIGALLFSTLFHKQGVGLNLLIFSVITIIILILNNTKAFKQKHTIAYSIFYFITAVSIFLYNNTLSIVTNTLAFVTLVGQVSEQNTSIYVNWLNGLYSFIAGFFHRNFNVNESIQTVEPKKEIDYLHLTKIVGIPLAILIIFIALYKNGNPVFNNLINSIDFSVINFQWVLVALCGYYLFYNISKPVVINSATSKDIQLGNSLNHKSSLDTEPLKKEYQFGFIVISALNALIIIFLITDISFLLSFEDLRASVFSNQVHNGINALIASIIIAIIIILYFFRGDLNFYKKNRNLKLVAYTWIVLNAILVVNIIIKDVQYIYYFGLTYKRIGVLVYLLLTVIGLTTTFIKVRNLKNFWYLLRTNTVTAFIILVISCTLNWDSYITVYNLNYAKSMDFNYLIELSDNNTFILKDYSDENNLDMEKALAIEKKFKLYQNKLNDNSWQESQFDNYRIK